MTNNVIPFVRNEVTNPFETKAVAAAMTALNPNNGGTIGDVQAVAELCLDLLADFTAREVEESKGDDAEYSQLMGEVLCRLKVAIDMVESAPFMEVEFDD